MCPHRGMNQNGNNIRARIARFEALRAADTKLPPLTANGRSTSNTHQWTATGLSHSGRYLRRGRRLGGRSFPSTRISQSLGDSKKTRLPALPAATAIVPYQSPLPEIGHSPRNVVGQPKNSSRGFQLPPAEEESNQLSGRLKGLSPRGNQEGTATQSMVGENSNPLPQDDIPEEVISEEKSDQSIIEDIFSESDSEISENEDKKSIRSESGSRSSSEKSVRSESGSRSSSEERGPDQEEIAKLLTDIGSSDPNVRLLAVAQVRRQLCQERCPPVDMFLEAGVLHPIIECLRTDEDELQFEAAWVLTNIASGEQSQTEAVARSDALKELIRLMSSPSPRVREQSIWALGNIVGDGSELRNLAVSAGIVKPLFDATVAEDADLSLKRNSAWALANMFRFKENFAMSEEDMKLVLQAMANLRDCEDDTVSQDLMWGLNFLTVIDKRCSGIPLEAGFRDFIVNNLTNSRCPSLQHAAILTTKNIISGSYEQKEAMLSSDVLMPIKNILPDVCKKLMIRGEAANVLAIFLDGPKEHQQKVIDIDIITDFIQVMREDEEEDLVKKPVLSALQNLALNGTEHVISLLVMQGALECLLQQLQRHKPEEANIVLDCFLHILQKSNDVENVKAQIEEYGGFEIMQSFLNADDAELVTKTKNILKTYFDEEDCKLDEEQEKKETSPAEAIDSSNAATKYAISEAKGE